MEDFGADINMDVMYDDLEECWSTWQVSNLVFLPPDHDLGLGLLGQRIHEAVVELGIVLSHLVLLVNVDFGLSPDLVKSEVPIVVQEADEHLVRGKQHLLGS